MSTTLQEVRLVDLLSDLVQKGAVKVLVENEVKEIAGFYSRREPMFGELPGPRQNAVTDSWSYC